MDAWDLGIAEAIGTRPGVTSRDDSEYDVGRSSSDVRRRNQEKAVAFQAHLERLTPSQRKRRVRLFIRCPKKACELCQLFLGAVGSADAAAEVYLLPKTRHPKMTLCNGVGTYYGVDHDQTATITCRHGSGRLFLDFATTLALFSDVRIGGSRQVDSFVTLTETPASWLRAETVRLIGPHQLEWDSR